MADFFSNMKGSGRKSLGKPTDSIDWFNEETKETVKGGKDDPTKRFENRGFPVVGDMYMFVYDPKHKATLPFYDKFPLVLPVEYYGDGFLGINLHYLPPGERMGLFQSLQTIATNDKYNKSTKLNISYKLLKAFSSRFAGHQECVKRYLYGHVRSQFRYVNPADWSKVVMLPLQRWVVNPNKKYAGSPPY